MSKPYQQQDKQKVVVVTLTPAQADLVSVKNGTAITPVFPATPISRTILQQFLRGNAALKRLADSMVWGHLTATEYQTLTANIESALKTTDEALKAVFGHLKKMDQGRSKSKSPVKPAKAAKAAEPIKKTEPIGKKAAEVVFT